LKAIVVEDQQALAWKEVDAPELSPNEILIRVKATAINRADLMQRRGLYPPPPGASDIMGLECAGVVEALGQNVTRFSAGDHVCALLAGGGYAEMAAVDEGSAVPIPDGLSFNEAAALPEVYATAWLNLFIEADLQPGERALIHAGASGVGSAAIQLCRSFGVDAFVTVGSADKVGYCTALGASGGHVRHSGSFVDAVKAWSSNQGVDVILDPVGAGYLDDNLECLRLGGRLVLIGLMSGARTELDMGKLMMKRLRVIGSTLRARPLVEKKSVMAELERYVWPKLANGEISPQVDAVFPIQDADQAHALMASDETKGKVVLAID
jgi:putative PIG3 family NAD(P)H quinone oxidoreductase